jgi:hypothetical protein
MTSFSIVQIHSFAANTIGLTFASGSISLQRLWLYKQDYQTDRNFPLIKVERFQDDLSLHVVDFLCDPLASVHGMALPNTPLPSRPAAPPTHWQPTSNPPQEPMADLQEMA